jgi:DNA processing protein
VTSREAYIALNMMQGVGPVTVRNLVAALGSPEAIFEAEDGRVRGAEGVGRDMADRILAERGKADPAGEVERAAAAGARLVTPVDAEYPKRLRTIYDPPLALYVCGTLESRDEHAIAIVGSRRTTHYGLETAERLAAQLAQSGVTVVSGLARGIDTAAHRGALKGRGRTLAVLGGGLDCLFPPENAGLAREIAGQGAVLTEYPMGREPDKTTFPVRNRIVSGLSQGVVVVEAATTSGAMITATQAMEQGRTVMAVPGRVDSQGSRGPHQLIKQGAKLVEGVEDVLEEFEQLLPTPRPSEAGGPARRPPLSEPESRLTEVLDGEGEMDTDSLARALGTSAAELSSLLLMLEMKRVIRVLPGRRVALRRA